MSGQQAARRLEVQLEHGVDAEAARDPLVGERRVDVAVAEHGGAASQGRCDHALDQLRARRGEQRGLGPGDDLLVAVEDDLPHGLAELGAARLARGHDFAAVGLERPLQELDLRRLARAVEALEGDEHAGQHREEPRSCGAKWTARGLPRSGQPLADARAPLRRDRDPRAARARRARLDRRRPGAGRRSRDGRAGARDPADETGHAGSRRPRSARCSSAPRRRSWS